MCLIGLLDLIVITNTAFFTLDGVEQKATAQNSIRCMIGPFDHYLILINTVFNNP